MPRPQYPETVPESIATTGLRKSADIVLAGTLEACWPGPPATPRGATSSVVNTASDPLSTVMERYASGEARVFAQLYRLLAPRLYRFCLRLTSQRHEADDCFQETLLRLHRARATYVPGANALHWAFAIARSVYLSRLRYWRRRPEVLGAAYDAAESADLHAHDATPEAEVTAQHLQAVLAAELLRMSEKNRVAYILLKEEDLTAKEAAAVLGTTSEVVRQRAHRAYECLKAALNGASPGEQDVDTL
jgi:RNA polymerase sigma-70 factor, ECF subfamily